MKIFRYSFMVVGILFVTYGLYGYHLGKIRSMSFYGQTRLVVGDGVFGEALGYIIEGMVLFLLGLLVMSDRFLKANKRHFEPLRRNAHIPGISEEMEYVIERRRKEALLKKIFSSPILLTIFIIVLLSWIFGIIRALIGVP